MHPKLQNLSGVKYGAGQDGHGVFLYINPLLVQAMDEGSKGIRHGGGGFNLRCPVYTTVHFSLRNEGSSEYIRV
jgi:hypothetical protein